MYKLTNNPDEPSDEDIRFLEVIRLPGGFEYQEVPEYILNRALFTLHLIGGTSYFKTCCPKNIVINSGSLDSTQTAFWGETFEKGLLEFFYKNDLDPTELIKFPEGEPEQASEEKERPFDPKKILVPIGGGKDSIVTIEILRKAGWDITLLRMGDHPLITELVEEIGLPCLTVNRTISEELLKLNEEGAMNGHIPITAYLSALSTVIAIAYGFGAIVMSNERSSDEGNLEKWGKTINHQWSKSWEFEKLFSKYIARYITPDLKYFSLLRHLSELSIVRYLTLLPQYLNKVTSCNRNWKMLEEGRPENRWCCECPKCASTFALFAAFISKDQLVEIFGKNLFEDPMQGILYKQLLGIEGNKPFECVGTVDEMRTAFLLAHEQGNLDDTPAMQNFINQVLPNIKDPEALKEKELSPGTDHSIPKEFLSALHAPEES